MLERGLNFLFFIFLRELELASGETLSSIERVDKRLSAVGVSKRSAAGYRRLTTQTPLSAEGDDKGVKFVHLPFGIDTIKKLLTFTN